jgi:predicted anti-sigma-YlaC factor YlaD
VVGVVQAVVAIVPGAVVVAVVAFHHRTREGASRSGL